MDKIETDGLMVRNDRLITKFTADGEKLFLTESESKPYQLGSVSIKALPVEGLTIEDPINTIIDLDVINGKRNHRKKRA